MGIKTHHLNDFPFNGGPQNYNQPPGGLISGNSRNRKGDVNALEITNPSSVLI